MLTVMATQLLRRQPPDPQLNTRLGTACLLVSNVRLTHLLPHRRVAISTFLSLSYLLHRLDHSLIKRSQLERSQLDLPNKMLHH